MRILVADDSTDDLSLFRGVLEEKGFQVVTAPDGEEALKRLHEEPSDLILSDILMPVMDGFRLLQECKTDGRLQKIPFIFITSAVTDKKDEELASRAGVSAIIRKPVEPAELIRVVEDVLSHTGSRRWGRKPKAEKAAIEKLSIDLIEKLEARMLGLEQETAAYVQAEHIPCQGKNDCRILLDTMTQGVACMNAEGKIVSINPAARKILGLTEEQVRGKTVIDTRWAAVREDGTNFPADEFPMVVALRESKLVKDVIMGFFNREDESYHWVRGSAAPQFENNEGTPLQVCGVFEDITDWFLAFKALQENESRLNAMMENTADIILLIDRDYCLVSANGAAYKFGSLMADRISLGQNILESLPSDRQAFWDGNFRRALCGKPVTFQQHYDTEKGELDFEFSVNPVLSSFGTVSRVSVFGRNITERKRSEIALQESEERYRLLIENSPETILVVQDGLVKFARSGLSPIVGYTGEEIMRLPLTKMIHPDDLPVLLEMHAHRMSGKKSEIEVIYRAIHRSGAVRWVKAHVTDVSWEGRPASLLFQSDITEQRSMEETIEKTSRLYKMLSLCNEAVVFADDEQKLLQRTCEIMVETGGYHMVWVGYAEPDNLKSLRPLAGSGFKEDYREFADMACGECVERSGPTAKAISDGITMVNQDVSADPDFAPWMHWSRKLGFIGTVSLPLKIAGKVIGALVAYASKANAFNEDEIRLLEQLAVNLAFGISSLRERRQREETAEALQASEARYRFIASNTIDVIWAMDKDLRFTYISPSITRQLGYSVEEAMQLGPAGLTTPSSLEAFNKDVETVIAEALEHHGSQSTFTQQLQLYRKDGSTIWSEISYTILVDEKGEFNRLLGVSRDITERKKFEAELSEREEKYRNLIEVTYDAIAVAQDGKLKFFNRRVGEISGYSDDELYDMPVGKLVFPEDWEMIADQNRRRMEGEPGQDIYSFRYVAKDGRVGWAEINNVLTEWEGKPALLTSLRDISERKAVEQALEESEEKYRVLVESAGEAILVEQDGLMKYANGRMAELLGYSVEELVGTRLMNYVQSEDLELVEGFHNERVKGNDEGLTHVFRFAGGKGRTGWVESHAVPIAWEGKPATLSFLSDITQRKKAEDAVRASEEKYRTMLENMYEGYYELDTEGNYIYVNDAVVRQMGSSRDEILKLKYKDFLPPEAVNGAAEIFSEVLRSGKPRYWLPLVSKRQDGTELYHEVSMYPMRNDKGEITGMRGLSRDVTEQRLWEATLRESEEKFRRLFEQSPVGAALVGYDDYWIKSANAAMCDILGYTADELSNRTFEGISPADDLEKDRENTKKLAKGESERYITDKKYVRRDGSVVWVHISVSLIKNAEGKPLYYLPMVENITERKKAEEELHLALGQVTYTLEGSMDAIAMMSELRDPYTAGHQRRVTQLAIAIATEMGFPEEQLHALRIAGLLHDVGKVYVPSEILSKPGKLTELEKGLVKAHAEAGYNIVKTIKFPWPVHTIIRQHHERMDGSGYPAGLKGEQIMPEARVLSVADVVEAMMSHRPYRPALGPDKALAEIISNRGTLYDEKAVDTCVSLFRDKGFHFME